jgi:predicted RNase H-like nuclease
MPPPSDARVLYHKMRGKGQERGGAAGAVFPVVAHTRQGTVKMAQLWGGVDGCRGGWVLALIDSSRTVTAIHVLKTFAEAVIAAGEAGLTLVDIPIGLPSQESPRDRLCDTMVRQELGPRASSVFQVPTREAVWTDDYTEASRRNQQILGRKLSKQSWGICPKIREADAVFRLVPRLQERVRETHPELCFRWLNGGRPVENSKKSSAGQKIRRELLRSGAANLDAVLKQARRSYRSRSLSLDDLLDAAAAAVLARLASEGKVNSVPLAREYDACGLAMEIVGM